ncbi:MAG TPA: hypothetical protein VN778_05245 [Verrucomicrobiae bacterium]|nr:hypothetical protein [Verrucomicrobiae bacterium]
MYASAGNPITPIRLRQEISELEQSVAAADARGPTEEFWPALINEELKRVLADTRAQLKMVAAEPEAA